MCEKIARRLHLKAEPLPFVLLRGVGENLRPQFFRHAIHCQAVVALGDELLLEPEFLLEVF